MSSNQSHDSVDGIELRQILPDAQIIGSEKLKIQSACGKWDECQSGDLFVAINDPEHDGHSHVNSAVDRGAIAVVSERLLPINVSQYIVNDTRVAYGQVCHALAGKPSQRLGAIGISGCAGKTVTAHLVHNILKCAGITAGLASTIETRYGNGNTSPPVANTSAGIAFELSRMVVSRCSHAVIEASSIELAQKTNSAVELESAVITNSMPTNLDFHGNYENYFSAQRQILDAVKPTGFAVLNADDKNCDRMLNHSQVPTLTYGIHQQAEVTAKILERNASFQIFMLSAGSESVPVRTTIIGKQHIYNCLAAATVGLTMGIDLDVIVSGLESVSIPGRLERVDHGQPYGVWIDSSLQPSQLNSAITALSQICDGRLWCLCSTDRAQSEDDRKKIGAILERKTEKPILTQSKSSGVIDYEPCHQILDGFDNPAVAHVLPNRIEAIEWVLSQAKPKDVVLISGAGEKPIAFVDDSNIAITDYDICAAYLSDSVNGMVESRSEIFKIDDYR